MSEFKLKMDGRNMMKIPRLLSRYNKADLQKDNWVTLGVVVHKTEPRQSAAVCIYIHLYVQYNTVMVISLGPKSLLYNVLFSLYS